MSFCFSFFIMISFIHSLIDLFPVVLLRRSHYGVMMHRMSFPSLGTSWYKTIVSIDQGYIGVVGISWGLAVFVGALYSRGVKCDLAHLGTYTEDYINDYCTDQHSIGYFIALMFIQSLALSLPYAVWSGFYGTEIDTWVKRVRAIMDVHYNTTTDQYKEESKKQVAATLSIARLERDAQSSLPAPATQGDASSVLTGPFAVQVRFPPVVPSSSTSPTSSSSTDSKAQLVSMGVPQFEFVPIKPPPQSPDDTRTEAKRQVAEEKKKLVAANKAMANILEQQHHLDYRRFQEILTQIGLDFSKVFQGNGTFADNPIDNQYRQEHKGQQEEPECCTPCSCKKDLPSRRNCWSGTYWFMSLIILFASVAALVITSWWVYDPSYIGLNNSIQECSFEMMVARTYAEAELLPCGATNSTSVCLLTRCNLASRMVYKYVLYVNLIIVSFLAFHFLIKILAAGNCLKICDGCSFPGASNDADFFYECYKSQNPTIEVKKVISPSLSSSSFVVTPTNNT
jgi:hypothetical protein